jgi:hypothetical protein
MCEHEGRGCPGRNCRCECMNCPGGAGFHRPVLACVAVFAAVAVAYGPMAAGATPVPPPPPTWVRHPIPPQPYILPSPPTPPGPVVPRYGPGWAHTPRPHLARARDWWRPVWSHLTSWGR